MKAETTALAVKSAATGIAAAFGLTWWALAAALLGAVASLHFEKPATGSTVWRVLLQILALALMAALLGVFLPHAPLFAWTAPEGLPPDVALVVRTGLLGLFANPVYTGIRAVIARRTTQGG